MSNKRNIISAITVSCFVAALGTASIATAATISPAADQSLNNHIILASYGEKDEHSGHHGGHHGGDEHNGGCCKMSSLDTDNDGKISRREFMRHHGEMFNAHDTDSDGFIDMDEMQGMMNAMRKHHGGGGDHHHHETHEHHHHHGEEHKHDEQHDHHDNDDDDHES